MRAVDMNTVILVHSGEAWPHKQSPCSRQMLQFLERNEGVVTWVQPKEGKVEDQYPVIRIGDKYFTMSLRMMKAVWYCPHPPSFVPCFGHASEPVLSGLSRRSVRLRKGFVNVERAPFGGLKLKIPTLLFVEKMRTQSRFNVSPLSVSVACPSSSRFSFAQSAGVCVLLY